LTFSTLGFFHQNILPGPLIKGIKPFRIKIRIREDIQILQNACGVIDTACTQNFLTTSKSENHMQNSYGMQKKMKNACGVNGTACTVHGVSMTSHAR
jgi:hypothetical protein